MPASSFSPPARPASAPAQIPAGALVGFLAFLGFALQTLSLKFVSPGKSAFLTGVSIPLVPLLSSLLFRVRPGGWEIVGAPET